MNEYSIYYLNGIITHLTADDWKDAINEAKINAQRKEFSANIKMIIDEDSQHRITLRLVERADGGHVTVQKAVLHHLGNHALVEAGGCAGQRPAWPAAAWASGRRVQP